MNSRPNGISILQIHLLCIITKVGRYNRNEISPLSLRLVLINLNSIPNQNDKGRIIIIKYKKMMSHSF